MSEVWCASVHCWHTHSAPPTHQEAAWRLQTLTMDTLLPSFYWSYAPEISDTIILWKNKHILQSLNSTLKSRCYCHDNTEGWEPILPILANKWIADDDDVNDDVNRVVCGEKSMMKNSPMNNNWKQT